MKITILKKIGLSDKEIRVYLVLLEHKSISVRNLAQEAGFNRGTVYDGLKKLCDLGLAGFYGAKGRQKYSAETPEKILDILEKKETEIKKTRKELEELVLSLKAIAKKDVSQPTAKFFENRAGIKRILNDLLEVLSREKDKIYYAYSAKNGSEDLKKAFPQFTQQRIKKDIKVKVISLAKGGNIHGLDERRWLGTNDLSASFILLYAGRCVFISRDKFNLPVGVVIENEMIFQTQKMIFENLWRKLKNKK